ncbi:MAG: hypothetical protein F6K23_03360 [Okeania sp. SIO2C9]|uniref:hypothetical protein n=1 Tax=Okeania sp. SIO2C9 TaxID=2607791 RepID=UPI0013C03F11|nr:hypothetical protein [Okeania sp. SIO2C9]NEQ72195.1 hypothetical protein [Okeania sp. SIO2C9]
MNWIYAKLLLVAGGHSETLNGRGGKHQTTAKEAAPCVSGSYAKQSVNPPKSYGSVGIPAPLGRGGCQGTNREGQQTVILARIYG